MFMVTHRLSNLFFDEEDTLAMISAVNEVEPDVLFVGMTAPKQEKWSFEHFHRLKAGHICCIGAVFDFMQVQSEEHQDG